MIDSYVKYATALRYYEENTAQIEIVRDNRLLERITFRKPQICSYLTDETKTRVYQNAELDERGSKIPAFFQLIDALFNEMNWQRMLQTRYTFLYSISRHMSTWSSWEFYLSCIVSLIVIISTTSSFEQSNTSSSSLVVEVLQNNDDGDLTPLVVGSVNDSTSGLSGNSTKLGFESSQEESSSSSCLASSHTNNTDNLLLNWSGFLMLVVSTMHLFSIIINRGWFRYKRLLEFDVLYHVAYLFVCLLGFAVSPLFYPLLLLNIIYREETLRNVIKSVTKNGYSILSTGFLGLTIILIFAIVGFTFFAEDFVIELEDGERDLPCKQSLWKCYLALINHGLRSGGGVGDIMINTAPSVSNGPKEFYKLSFYLIFNIILVQLIFGVILDTFGELRGEKQRKEEILQNSCFVCGLERAAFEDRTVTFEAHVSYEHNLWDYLYFIVLLKIKDQTEFTGQESYVYSMLASRNLDWFPRMRAMSLHMHLSQGGDASLTNWR